MIREQVAGVRTRGSAMTLPKWRNAMELDESVLDQIGG